MNRYLKCAMFAVVVSLMVGCSDPRIDASTEEALKVSSQKVRESLSAAKRAEFDQALKILAFSRLHMKDIFAAGATGIGDMESRMRSALDKKTADEVIAEAAKIQAGKQEYEQTQAEKRERVQEETAATLKCLQEKVTLTKPHFEGSDGSWLEVDIANNLSWAISGYHMAYVIKGDDRSVPVKQDDTFSKISGGIEPGETKSVSVWAGADIAPYKSVKVEVSLINIFDSENRKLVDNNTNYMGSSPHLSPNGCR